MSHQIRPLQLVVKAFIFFVILTLVCAWLAPSLPSLSIYSRWVPGRLRFPLPGLRRGEGRPWARAPASLTTLFNSHVVAAAPKPPGEYRVFLLGDSQTWSPAVYAADSLGELLNRNGLIGCGKNLHVFNLAYPFPSVLKDFLILQHGLRYQPDLVVWLLTLDSFVPAEASVALADDDPAEALETLQAYGLTRYGSLIAQNRSFIQRLPIWQAAAVHRWALFEVSGPVWAGTGIDAPWTPAEYSAYVAQLWPITAELAADTKYRGFMPPDLPKSRLYFDVLPAVREALGNIPLLVVVQPMFIGGGKNSSIRYNLLYPRWAFDQFLPLMQAAARGHGWGYLDFHALLPPTDFADPTYHLKQNGEAALAASLTPKILEIACR